MGGGGGLGRTQNLPAPHRAPQENPYLWNNFADGKLLYRNSRLLCAVRHNEDKVVREFWRLLAICHTVMVQEKDSECAHPLPAWEGAQAPGPRHAPAPSQGLLALSQAPPLLDHCVSRPLTRDLFLLGGGGPLAQGPSTRLPLLGREVIPAQEITVPESSAVAPGSVSSPMLWSWRRDPLEMSGGS